MKVIDLLNKIANGEEVPKKIRYEDDIYILLDNNCYHCEETNSILSYRIFAEHSRLNEEVEILEEEKKIPEKLEEFGIIQYNLDYIDYKNIETLKEWLNKDFQTIYDTLDLIIKNQNKLIDYLKSKGE